MHREPMQTIRELRPLTRATPKGWVKWAFWFLRGYIVIMLAIVVIGFARGTL